MAVFEFIEDPPKIHRAPHLELWLGCGCRISLFMNCSRELVHINYNQDPFAFACSLHSGLRGLRPISLLKVDLAICLERAQNQTRAHLLRSLS